jgi:hypothetical protein
MPINKNVPAAYVKINLIPVARNADNPFSLRPDPAINHDFNWVEIQRRTPSEGPNDSATALTFYQTVVVPTYKEHCKFHTWFFMTKKDPNELAADWGASGPVPSDWSTNDQTPLNWGQYSRAVYAGLLGK